METRSVSVSVGGPEQEQEELPKQIDDVKSPLVSRHMINNQAEQNSEHSLSMSSIIVDVHATHDSNHHPDPYTYVKQGYYVSEKNVPIDHMPHTDNAYVFNPDTERIGRDTNTPLKSVNIPEEHDETSGELTFSKRLDESASPSLYGIEPDARVSDGISTSGVFTDTIDCETQQNTVPGLMGDAHHKLVEVENNSSTSGCVTEASLS